MTSIIEIDTVSAIIGVLPSIRMIFPKLIALRTSPKIMLTRNSFHITRKASLTSISSVDIPRMIREAAWVPAFPPVPDKSGI